LRKPNGGRKYGRVVMPKVLATHSSFRSSSSVSLRSESRFTSLWLNVWLPIWTWPASMSGRSASACGSQIAP